MRANWRIFTDTTNEKATNLLLRRLAQAAGMEAWEVTITPYAKGGFVASFHTQSNSSSWAETVIELLAVAQQIGHGWQVTGSILEELHLWSNKTTVAGVQSIHLYCLRKQE